MYKKFTFLLKSSYTFLNSFCTLFMFLGSKFPLKCSKDAKMIWPHNSLKTAPVLRARLATRDVPEYVQIHGPNFVI